MNTRKAFTLLEILISVVVLAIGLVGAVAIFPAVIDLQRRAQDAVIGTAMASSAEAQINAALVENESVNWLDEQMWTNLYGSTDFDYSDQFPPVDVLTRDRGISVRDFRTPSGGPPSVTLDFLWEADWEWENFDALRELQVSGDLVLGGGEAYEPISQNNRELPTYRLDLASRLMPDASSTADPRYVYDIVVRRADSGVGAPPRGDRRRYEKQLPQVRLGEVPVQIAIFTRRIDRAIRVPQGVSLRDSLTGAQGVAARDRRFPLAVSSEDLAETVPNGKGNDPGVVYSHPLEALLRNESFEQTDPNTEVYDLFNPNRLRFRMRGMEDETVTEKLSKVGQMFVDNQGVVRTVTGITKKAIDGDEVDLLIIDPPFSTNNTEVYRQIIFTPQVPVGVRVVTTR
ncbi:MAG: hypothetical protein Phyf2KO_05750 [Phycisphaerales bacterium]